MFAETIAGRLKDPKIVRPSLRRNAEYVAKGILVRPIERTMLGVEVVGVVVDGVGVFLILLWPKSWANLTSFQIPTEELTKKVDANVVIPAIAWSILG
jgi:hypothetical protein